MDYDTYNLPRTEHYERVERDREFAPMTDEETEFQRTAIGAKILRQVGVKTETKEQDLIDLHIQENEEKEEIYQN